MDRFVNRQNIERYRRLADETTNPTERLRVIKLLAEERAKFKLELKLRRGATVRGFEPDREEQRGAD
jgi:coproporphyrinogen III oxidase-like Fe-S oxidoreductase